MSALRLALPVARPRGSAAVAELTAADVASFTGGRLPANDATAELLNAALAAARRYCGWHVSPVMEQTVTLDGPGGRVLSLPTLNLVSVAEIDDDGEVLTAADLRVARVGSVRKVSGGSWSQDLGSVTVKFTHGYTEAEAADWRRAVLLIVDSMSRDSGSSDRDDPRMSSKRVDDVEYHWFSTPISADARLSAAFAQFRIMLGP